MLFSHNLIHTLAGFNQADQLGGASYDLLDAVFDASPVGIYVVDTEFRIRLVNRVARPVFGNIGELIGRDFAEVIHILWPEEYAAEIARRFRHTLETGEPYVTPRRAEWRRDSGMLEYYEWSIHRIVVLDGQNSVVCYFIDIGERVRAEASLAHLAAIVTSSDDAIISKDLQGILQTWNAGAQRIFGYTADESIGKPATLLMPPDRVNEEPEILERIRRGEVIDHYDTVRQRKDGSLVDISLTVSPLRDGTGRIIGATKIARDISERKQAERDKALLSRELQHRTRNMLGIIQSIARRTLTSGTSVEQAKNVFLARLTALGHANELLAHGDWHGAALKDVVERALEPFAMRFSAEGRRILLNSKATQGFTLVIHELSTNAHKHGAFSVPSGTVAIRWTLDDTSKPARLMFRWEEAGGPQVVPPKQTNFGTQLLKAAIGGAEVHFDFAAQGLIYTLAVPISTVVDEVA